MKDNCRETHIIKICKEKISWPIFPRSLSQKIIVNQKIHENTCSLSRHSCSVKFPLKLQILPVPFQGLKSDTL